MSTFTDFGSGPSYEEGAATGITENAGDCNRLECRAFMLAIERVYGAPPVGLTMKIRGNPHEFGTYYEVRAYYQSDDPAAVAWAFAVENGNRLRSWADAGMQAPVVYNDRHQSIVIRHDESEWITGPVPVSA
jgi:hypothetical protein